MTGDLPGILSLHVEPTPYVLGFLRSVRRLYRGSLHSYFIGMNLSQPWDLPLEPGVESMLPQGLAAAAARVRRELTTGRIGVLHLAGWGHPLFLWAAMLAWWHRIPVCMESDTHLREGMPLWRRAIKSAVYPAMFRMVCVALPAGTRQAEYFRHYGVDTRRIVVAQMTVDVESIAAACRAFNARGDRSAMRQSFGLDPSKTTFVFVGRLEPRKGIATLIGAFGRLTRERDDVALLIAGDGSLRADVEAAASADSLVTYVGRLDMQAVIRALCCADVAVVPSLIEPFGLVVNEAMAAGLPVIASDRVGCVDDLVIPGRTGMLFPAGSELHLYEAMRELLDRPAERDDMSRAAAHLISGWTLERQACIAIDAWLMAQRIGPRGHLQP